MWVTSLEKSITYLLLHLIYELCLNCKLTFDMDIVEYIGVSSNKSHNPIGCILGISEKL